jgi:hypothetical protein
VTLCIAQHTHPSFPPSLPPSIPPSLPFVILQLISSRTENSKMHRKLRGKEAVWEELKEDVVYKVGRGGGACSLSILTI